MKIFVDANVLVSVLNKEYPLFTHTSRILSLADSAGFQIYTSPVCLAIAFYFAQKNIDQLKQKKKSVCYAIILRLLKQQNLLFKKL